MMSISFAQNLVPYRLGDKWGYAEYSTKKLIIPTQYDEARPFHGNAAVVRVFTKYGLIDKQNNLITGLIYDYIDEVDYELYRYELNGKYGYLNQSGQKINKREYGWASEYFDDGYISVEIDDSYLEVDTLGNEFTFEEADDREWQTRDIKKTELKNKFGINDLNNNVVVNCIYDTIMLFDNCYLKVKSNNNWGILENQGKEIISPQYDEISYVNDNLMTVKKNDKYGVIDYTGDIIIPIEYKAIYDFSEGIFKCITDEGYGFISVVGAMIVQPGKYKRMERFQEGRAKVQSDETYGFVDKQGNEIVPLKYESASSFKQGRANVKKNGKYGFIDYMGSEVISPQYDYTGLWFENGVVSANIYAEKLFFYIDTLGNEYYEKYIPPKYKQYPQVSAWNTETRKIKSKASNEEYSLFIYTPRDYKQTNKTYPVVYLLDADYTFGIARDAVESMTFGKDIPNMIIVGVAYGKSFDDWFSKRTRDMTPTNDTTAKMFPGGGGCDKFYNFIKDELVSYVDKNFRVVPNERTLIGYSFGGLFSFYTMFKSPDLFNRYLIISPSLWWDNKLAFNWETEYANTYSDLYPKIVMTYGEKEWGMGDNVKQMHDVLKTRNYPGLNLTYWETKEQTHTSIFPIAFVNGIKAIFKD
jgi:predicted alpha/beta superfamily hydrolase